MDDINKTEENVMSVQNFSGGVDVYIIKGQE